ncbi:hypothetical protein [Methylotenera sp.]|uniref:hypothetical protein n=1 Tax=Methylotenera sp. TaxID=2051956 RepID=UPI0027302F91|nr:hypothetical protein [Methylotenera sp.]MDP2072300.1 hypothetical protein [Methylotenera sp.]MDP3005099.1 hypothetical protein [Methylotenera sp.]
MYIINNANDLLNAMLECEIVVTLNGDMLEVKQARWIDNDLAVLIKTHKNDLINILESEI